MAAFTELLCPSPFSLRQWQTNAICRMHFYSRLAQGRRSYPWCQEQCRALLSHHQRTNSWLRSPVVVVPPPSKGEGSSTVCCSISLLIGELWESQPTGYVSSQVVQLGEIQALFVWNRSCTRALMFPQEPPVPPSPLQLHPGMQHREHKKGEMSGIKTTLLFSSPTLLAQPIWNKS